MKLPMNAVIVTIITSTTFACSDSNFTPAKNDTHNAPSSKDGKTAQSPNANQSSSTSQGLPSLNPDSNTLKADLVDTSVAQFLLSPTNTNSTLAQSVRAQLANQGVNPLQDGDFRSHSAAKVALGKMLFNDRILSGNMTVSCASCHVVWRGMGDGTSLMNDIGVKGIFSHIDQPANQNLLPRNTMPLFNRGHKSFTSMFWDGRVEPKSGMPSGFNTPATTDLPNGLDSVVAAQALFPLTSREEMLGDAKNNAIAAKYTNPKDVWNALMVRIKNNAQYMSMLHDAYPGVADDQLGIQHIANALAAYQDVSFRADASAFDQFLKGDDSAMTVTALQGAELFYGRAQCSTCHTGSLQSDQQFHAISVPQFGIGKGDGVNQREDYGRGRVTGKSTDRYKFRTPSLRNVYITGPWGHDGAFSNLTDYIRHYTAPVESMNSWDAGKQLILRTKQWPQGFFDPHMNPAVRQTITNANEFPGVQLSDQDIAWLVEFLGTLTDRTYQSRDVTTDTVPSGMNDFLGIFGLKQEWFELLRPLTWL